MRQRFVPIGDWEDPRQILGIRGEQMAMAYLTSCGWSIEAHRFKLGRHDLDIVARRDHIVAFIEVKARRGAGFGRGAEAVGWRKQRTLARVAEIWRLRFGHSTDTYRFDLIEVDVSVTGSAAIAHHTDAWRLRGRE